MCRDAEHLQDMAEKALKLSKQILVEKSLKGWKEVRAFCMPFSVHLLYDLKQP
jgi:carbamoylphosphate synthase large subunit